MKSPEILPRGRTLPLPMVTLLVLIPHLQQMSPGLLKETLVGVLKLSKLSTLLVKPARVPHQTLFIKTQT